MLEIGSRVEDSNYRTLRPISAASGRRRLGREEKRTRPLDGFPTKEPLADLLVQQNGKIVK